MPTVLGRGFRVKGLGCILTRAAAPCWVLSNLEIDMSRQDNKPRMSYWGFVGNKEKFVWGLHKDCTPLCPTKHEEVLDATMVTQSYTFGMCQITGNNYPLKEASLYPLC